MTTFAVSILTFCGGLIAGSILGAYAAEVTVRRWFARRRAPARWPIADRYTRPGWRDQRRRR